MVAISSFRPHGESEEYRRNQLRAKESWEKVFDRIIYFGHAEPELASGKTTFIGHEGWPTIREVAAEASRQFDMVTVLNADIVLTRNFFALECRMRESGALACTSRRYTFNPDEPIEAHKCVIEQQDKGLDVFVMMPALWARMAVEMPESLRMGHQQWDTWVSGWCTFHLGHSFRNFNELRAILHPRHNGRKMPHADSIKTTDRYISMAEWPAPL